jgi:ABC-type multidrug transport system fused ATPase/permease subunit
MRMSAVSGIRAEQALGRLPPLEGTVTVEKVAINAVMAAWKPTYFLVVLAAVRGCCSPSSTLQMPRLGLTQTSTTVLGEFIALVGPFGSGKLTIVCLLLSLETPRGRPGPA